MKYITGTGYFAKPNSGAEWFYRLWWDNIHKYSKPERVFVVGMGGCSIPAAPGSWVEIDGDLGHVHDILNRIKPYPYCACGVALCILALIAYSNECDFVYHEQDALAFGPYVEKMYEEIGDGQLIMGKQRGQPVANSIMLVKHSFLLEFVTSWLTSEPETSPDNIGEHKFGRWAERNNKLRFYSFGYDRDRPFNVDDPVWHAQKFNKEELELLKSKGLVDFDSIPDSISRFSNCPEL
jgi:hypothetical protein